MNFILLAPLLHAGVPVFTWSGNRAPYKPFFTYQTATSGYMCFILYTAFFIKRNPCTSMRGKIHAVLVLVHLSSAEHLLIASDISKNHRYRKHESSSVCLFLVCSLFVFSFILSTNFILHFLNSSLIGL